MKIKFLIIRFSSIGDIVLTTPVIRCLKQQVENAEIHYTTKKQFASIINTNPYIDKIHLLDGKLNDLINELKKENFDYIIDLHNNLRSSIIKTRLKAIAFSFNKINLQKWLMVTFKVNKLPKKHIVERYLETCKIFGVENDNIGLDFFIEKTNEVNLKSIPDRFKNGYAAIVIGAKHNTKQLPVEKLARLCKEINCPIILLGGKEDNEKAKIVIEKSGKNEILNACGNYNLQQSASLVKQAKVVITHDTGLMHIAAAFNQHIISVWGNTMPEFGMFPYQPGKGSVIFEVKNLRCRPVQNLVIQNVQKGTSIA